MSCCALKRVPKALWPFRLQAVRFLNCWRANEGASSIWPRRFCISDFGRDKERLYIIPTCYLCISLELGLDYTYPCVRRCAKVVFFAFLTCCNTSTITYLLGETWSLGFWLLALLTDHPFGEGDRSFHWRYSVSSKMTLCTFAFVVQHRETGTNQRSTASNLWHHCADANDVLCQTVQTSNRNSK